MFCARTRRIICAEGERGGKDSVCSEDRDMIAEVRWCDRRSDCASGSKVSTCEKEKKISARETDRIFVEVRKDAEKCSCRLSLFVEFTCHF